MSATTQPSRLALLTMQAPASAFAGTGALLRLALRRSRIRIPAWAIGSALLNVSVASSWDRLYPSTEERLSLAASLSGDPTLSSILGPLFDPVSTGGLTAWRVGSGSTIALSLAASFLVVRHSRADEAQGRTELVLGTPVGRAAPLTAALLAASIMLGLFAVVSAVALSAMGLGVMGSIAFAATVSAASLVFAGVAGVATQMARTSRAANGIAGATAGLAFLVTAVGNGQTGGSPLPWLTPFGWMQQTRAYAGERWWLIALSLVVSGALALAALHVESRRDVGDGLLAQRRGRAHAKGWISGPVALAWRLDSSAGRSASPFSAPSRDRCSTRRRTSCRRTRRSSSCCSGSQAA
jgi:ABC-2 type transport system permease protein